MQLTRKNSVLVHLNNKLNCPFSTNNIPEPIAAHMQTITGTSWLTHYISKHYLRSTEKSCYLAITAKAVHAFVMWTAWLTYGSELKRESCSFRNLSPNILARLSPGEIKNNNIAFTIYGNLRLALNLKRAKSKPLIRTSPAFRACPALAILARSVTLATRWSSVISIIFPLTLTKADVIHKKLEVTVNRQTAKLQKIK